MASFCKGGALTAKTYIIWRGSPTLAAKTANDVRCEQDRWCYKGRGHRSERRSAFKWNQQSHYTTKPCVVCDENIELDIIQGDVSEVCLFPTHAWCRVALPSILDKRNMLSAFLCVASVLAIFTAWSAGYCSCPWFLALTNSVSAIEWLCVVIDHMRLTTHGRSDRNAIEKDISVCVRLRVLMKRATNQLVNRDMVG